MIKKICYLSIVVSLFLFIGCDNTSNSLSEKATVALQAQKDDILKNYTAVLLSSIVNLNFSNVKIFLLDSKTVLAVTNGETTLPSGENFSIVDLSRRYNAAKITIEIDNCEIKNIFRVRDKDYPVQATLLVSYKESYEAFENISGITISFVLPHNWNEFSATKRADYMQNLMVHLPAWEYDYFRLAQAPGIFSGKRYVKNLHLVYNKQKSRWEFAEKDKMIALPFSNSPWLKTHTAIELNKDLIKHGFIEYSGKILPKHDVEILKKIYDGLVYVGGTWKHKIDVDMEKIIMSHPRYNFTISDVCNLISHLPSCRNPTQSKEIEELITIQTLQLIHINKDDEVFNKKVYSEILYNENWRLLKRFPQIKNEVEDNLNAAEAKKNQNEIDINLKNLAELHAKFAPYTQLAMLQKEYDKQVNKLFFMNDIYNKVQEAGIEKFQVIAQKLIVILALKNDDEKIYNKICNKNSYLRKWSANLFTDCPKCNNGVSICSHCNDNKICGVCRGKGGVMVDFIVGRELVSRWKECQYCPTAPCKHCNKQGVITIAKKELDKRFATLWQHFIIETQSIIKSYNEAIVPLEKKIKALQEQRKNYKK